MASYSTRLFAVVLLFIVALSACGGEQATSTPVGTSFDAPTATRSGFGETNSQATSAVLSEPTVEATAVVLSEPTVEATAVVLGDESGSTTSDGALQPVVIEGLETFTHPQGLFSIDVPQNWSLADNSNPEEAILVWSDPSQNGALIVDIFEEESSYSGEELVDILRTFLTDSFSEEPDFSIEEPVAQDDGSQLIVWGYTALASNAIEAPLLGNSFIEQRGNKVSILTALLPEDQFDALERDTEAILNSYTINADATLGDGTASDDTTAPVAEDLPETIIGVGEAYQIGAVEVVVNGSEEREGSEFFQPEEGNRFYLVDVSVTNISAEQTVVSSLL
ncbi:DUF4352 domain-containing protein, partial [Candidatus Gracilibacteria bacterium]|nr:DUF4352 domain-containing protein [Candidatus Gracilibacteria bacterium]